MTLKTGDRITVTATGTVDAIYADHIAVAFDGNGFDHAALSGVTRRNNFTTTWLEEHATVHRPTTIEQFAELPIGAQFKFDAGSGKVIRIKVGKTEYMRIWPAGDRDFSLVTSLPDDVKLIEVKG
jgi:hypothetical protein